jgi:uncharacterized protein YcgI (DUF1989 family)
MQSVSMSEALTAWEVHEVPAATGGAWRVPAGGLVRVTDVEGGQSGDVFFVDAIDMSDGLSNGRSFDYNGTVSLTVGARLFSSRSRTLATIMQDDVGRHDFLYTPCSQEMYEIQYGVTAPHPNCYDNLSGALSSSGSDGDGQRGVQCVHEHVGRGRWTSVDLASTFATG